MIGNPQNLPELVGQEAAVGILTTALREQRVGHAYLFVGPEGVGKLTAALLFAKALNCEEPPAAGQACGKCKSCVRFEHGNHPQIWRIAPMYRKQPITDPRLLELVEDQAWITIAQTRGDERDRPPHPAVLREAALKPVFSPYKVFVFEPADRMTEEAADSLLATLEEPPAGTVFILVSSRPGAMRETVVSRCEQVRFHMVAPQRIEELLCGRAGRRDTAGGGCATSGAAEPASPSDSTEAMSDQSLGSPGGACPTLDENRARLIAGLADGRPGRAISMARHPYLLEVRAEAIALAEDVFSSPVQAALALAARTEQAAQRLWELEFAAMVEQEREEERPGDAEAPVEAQKLRISYTRSMRRAVPQLLEMMAAWLRDLVVVKSGRTDLMINRDYREQAQRRAAEVSYRALRGSIEGLTRTAAQLRGYANLSPSLEAMYVELAEILGSGSAGC